jgi:hypothetical protein
LVSLNNLNLGVALLGVSETATSGLTGDTLAAWAAARVGARANAETLGQDPNAPLAPVWTPGLSPAAEALVRRALNKQPFFDTNAKLFSDLGAQGDYRRLFALYSGLATLQALAARAEDASLSKAQAAATRAQFARGLSELGDFFSRRQFEDVRLAQGDRVDAAQTGLALPSKSEDYLTGVIHRGTLYDRVAGLANDAEFAIVATSSTGTVRNVAIDLSEMGSIPRSLSNVISFVNTKLSAAGAASRLEAIDQTPKTNTIVIGGRATTTEYVGPKQYALKVDVRAGERVAFEPVSGAPSFYAVGAAGGGARLIKLQDVDGAAAQPAWLPRPGSTDAPTGAHIGAGWLGPGAPYATAPAGANEYRSNALVSDGANNFEDALRAPGEAVLRLAMADGRSLSVSTAWRSRGLEAWRVRSGESEDRGILDDLAERLTQLLHEQGVAAGVDVWQDGGELGFSVFTGDGVRAASLMVSGRSATLDLREVPGMVGGLRDGIFARRFEAPAVATATDLFVDDQTFVFTTAAVAHTIVIGGGESGIDASELIERLNDELRERSIAAAASLHDDGGSLSLRIDALHDMVDVSATINENTHDGVLQAPGAWAAGGLPAAAPGQPFGDAIRDYIVTGGAPLLTHAGGLDIEIVVATAAGDRTINVAVSALERADNPDVAPGRWSSVFQDRLDVALNAAGVYLSAEGGDLSSWSIAESAGQRLVSVRINGDALALEGATPAYGVGGAFSATRSFTSALASTSVSSDVAALLSDQTVSATFKTIWGERTVGATLEPGDPRSLESAALRLNEALAEQGYDLGLAAVALSGGGAGLRTISGTSNTVRGLSAIILGGVTLSSTLDPIDAASHVDDPTGAARVPVRAARGAAAIETLPGASPFTAPSANSSAWFPGRAFDVSVGGGARVATARAVAAGGDGAVYVVADLNGNSATSAVRGERDIALFKYDSAGKLVFTEILGAASSASGFALAVSADGKIAVAGSVDGGLSGTTAKGGRDSIVTVYDSAGAELWTARRGANADDEALAVAFDPNGNVIVAGRTESALSGQVHAGGADGYVRGYSGVGAELFAQQFGTVGADGATALLVRSDGAGGAEIFTAGVENNRGVVRRFTYSSAGFAAGAMRDIGYFHNGAINALAASGSSLYVGGEIGGERLSLGAAARGAVAGQEGFVARIDADLSSTTLDRATYLGSAQDDAVKGLAIVGGEVYAAGVSGGMVAGAGAAKSRTSFLSRLGDDGDAAWTRAFNSAGGAFTLNAIAVDAGGASPLDVLGLPRGEVALSDSGALTARSALRVGDEFRVGADGRRASTVIIGADDTLDSLVARINRAVGASGRAVVVKEDGAQRIKITARAGAAIRLDPGPDGRDALSPLGLSQAIVTANGGGRGALKTYGLGLVGLNLDTPAAIKSAKAELSAAISIVRRAYDDLLHPNAKELSEEEKALQVRRQNAGAAPQYLQAQLANYQAALARLGGG